MGDFNSIKEDGERIGGQPRPLAAMEEFNNCRLVELKSFGGICHGAMGTRVIIGSGKIWIGHL